MAIDNLPPFYYMNYTKQDGDLTDESYMFMDQTFQVLNDVVNMFINGMQMPNKTTAEITVYRDALSTPIGTVWLNTDLGGGPKLQVKTVQAVYNSSGVLITPGTIETIQSV